MSEKDRRLGGDAANKFASPSAYQAAGDGSAYQTSEQVRQHYYKSLDATSKTAVPVGWEDRARIRTAQAEHYGGSTKTELPAAPTATVPSTRAASQSTSTTTNSSNAQLALLRLTTQSLEALAATVLQDDMLYFPSNDRAAFAQAMQKAMAAMAKTKGASVADDAC